MIVRLHADICTTNLHIAVYHAKGWNRILHKSTRRVIQPIATYWGKMEVSTHMIMMQCNLWYRDIHSRIFNNALYMTKLPRPQRAVIWERKSWYCGKYNWVVCAYQRTSPSKRFHIMWCPGLEGINMYWLILTSVFNFAIVI